MGRRHPDYKKIVGRHSAPAGERSYEVKQPVAETMTSFPVPMEALLRADALQTVIDAIAVPVFVKDQRHRWVLVNDALCALVGRSKEQMIGKSDYDLFPREQADVFWTYDDFVFSTGQENQNEESITDRDGQVRTIVTCKRLVHIDGTPLIVAIITDITSFRQAQAHSEYLAYHDTLSGLPNRMLLEQRLDETISKTGRRRTHSALLCIDLDRFKEVNDGLGHPAGDELIREFSKRVLAMVRSTDTVARIGGDEFAVLLNGVRSPEVVTNLCRRVLDAARSPFAIGGTTATVGASIGVVPDIDKLPSATEMLRQGDVALYAAKTAGRNCFRVYSEEMDAERRAYLTIEAELRSALESGNGLEVYYQPLHSAASIVAVEALVRWNHPRLGLLSPAKFLPVAEDTGLIVALGDFVLEKACAACRNWPGLGLAVNVSVAQIRDPDFPNHVLSVLRKHRLPPKRLELEITETTILNADETLRTNLRVLRKAGVSVALDDFGTGYSSLSHLQDLEVDRIKIDRSFIDHLGDVSDSAPIVRAVIHVGRMLGLGVTAEGVETKEQQRFLLKHGCTHFQGYLMSPPVPESEIAGILASEPGRSTSAHPAEQRQVT